MFREYSILAEMFCKQGKCVADMKWCCVSGGDLTPGQTVAGQADAAEVAPPKASLQLVEPNPVAVLLFPA